MKRLIYTIGLKKILDSLIKRKRIVKIRFFETIDISKLKMSNISDLMVPHSDGKWQSIAKNCKQFVSTANPFRGSIKTIRNGDESGNGHGNGGNGDDYYKKPGKFA